MATHPWAVVQNNFNYFFSSKREALKDFKIQIVRFIIAARYLPRKWKNLLIISVHILKVFIFIFYVHYLRYVVCDIMVTIHLHYVCICK